MSRKNKIGGIFRISNIHFSQRTAIEPQSPKTLVPGPGPNSEINRQRQQTKQRQNFIGWSFIICLFSLVRFIARNFKTEHII